MDVLIYGYENTNMALHYGAMLRECIGHQIVAKYVLDSPQMKKFFDYIQLPNFVIAVEVAATSKELLTRHKSTVAKFLSKNYEWFFDEYNSKLLESSNYITRRQAVKYAYVRRHAMEKRASLQESKKLNQIFFPKSLKKVYPIRLQRSSSTSSLSSLSSSLSQNSDEASLTDSLNLADENISLALHLISPRQGTEPAVNNTAEQQQSAQSAEPGEMKRCNWITKNCDKAYIEFHDECWGVPAYDDKKLFELLTMSGLLIDYNWTEILKRKEILRKVFAGFDPNTVAKMGENEIIEIASNKEVLLTDCRVRCIVDNAKCIMKIVRICGSFSNYIWGYVHHKPVINRYRYPRDVPLRTPKADTISKDLIKHGFQFLGPVIVYSFMQAAGLTIDHIVDCYRHNECVRLAERPWRHL